MQGSCTDTFGNTKQYKTPILGPATSGKLGKNGAQNSDTNYLQVTLDRSQLSQQLPKSILFVWDSQIMYGALEMWTLKTLKVRPSKLEPSMKVVIHLFWWLHLHQSDMWYTWHAATILKWCGPMLSWRGESVVDMRPVPTNSVIILLVNLINNTFRRYTSCKIRYLPNTLPIVQTAKMQKGFLWFLDKKS